MTTDLQSFITDVNKQMEALTGCTRDELIGAPFKKYFTDPKRAEASIKQVLAESKVTNYELTARSWDGGQTVVSYNATTFSDRDRKLQSVFAAASWLSALLPRYPPSWSLIRTGSGKSSSISLEPPSSLRRRAR
jgi:PAS domain S-box-containing protein